MSKIEGFLIECLGLHGTAYAKDAQRRIMLWRNHAEAAAVAQRYRDRQGLSSVTFEVKPISEVALAFLMSGKDHMSGESRRVIVMSEEEKR